MSAPAPKSKSPPTWRPVAHKLDSGALALATASRDLLGVDESAMYCRAIITTPDRDRVGDEVIPDGCDLSCYRLNPVWFFGHQTIPFPIGTAENPQTRALDVRIVPGQHVEAGCWFHQATAEACQVFDLVARWKAIRGVSIAFNPLVEPTRVKHEEGSIYQGYRYASWELVEISWVGVPCNPYAGVVREYLSRDKSEGERIAPLVRKALQPLAEPKRAWLGWEPGRGDKAMSSSSGTDGGYLGLGGRLGEGSAEVSHHKLPPEVADGVPSEHHDTVKAIRHVMHCHKEDAHPDGPHDAYYHPEKGHVWHHHHKEAEEAHLGKVKDDMELIDGVHDLTQHTEPPNRGNKKEAEAEAGFIKVYGLPGVEGESGEEVHPSEQPAGEIGAVKWWKGLAKQFKKLNKRVGKAAASRLVRRSLKRYIKSAKAEHKDVEDCVHHKIPKLVAEGYAQDQAVAIAYSMCGEKKSLAKKGFDGEHGDGDGGEDGDGYDGDDGRKDGPDLAALIADLVSCVVALQEHATPAPAPPAKHNDEEDEPEDNADGKSETERTNEAMARYQRSGKGEVRKMHPRHKEDLMGALQGASDHLHKMAHCEPGHFGRRHKEESLVHARALDRHHGMISGMKDDPPPMPTDMPAEEQPGMDKEAEDDWMDEKTARAVRQKLESMEGTIRRINPSLLR